MIFPKKTFLAITLSLSAIVLLYMARMPLIKFITEEKLAQYNVKVTCLDFELNTDLQLLVNHLCLRTPQADISIDDMAITLQLSAENKIKRINIATISVQGTTELLTASNTSENKQPTATEQLHAYLPQLAQFTMPVEINVAKLRYIPYASVSKNKSSNKVTDTSHYLASLSSVNNTLDFSLYDFQQNKFLQVNFSTRNDNSAAQFSAKLTSQIKPLQHFLTAHKLPLPSAVSETLTSLESEGEFHSLINYRAGLLTFDSQLTRLKLTSAKGVETSGPFELAGALDIHGQMNITTENTSLIEAPELTVQFQPNNHLQLQYSQQNLINYLNKKAVSPTLITLLKNNPVTQLSLRPIGALTYNLNNQRLSLTGLEIQAAANNKVNESTPNPVHQLNLDNIALNLNHLFAAGLDQARNDSHMINAQNDNLSDQSISDKRQSHYQQAERVPLSQLDFTLDSPLWFSALNEFTRSAVALKLQGSIRQNQTKTTINFTENSALTSQNITLLTKKKTTGKKRLAIKHLKTQFQGKVDIEDDKNIFLNLTSQSQAKHLRADKLINLKSVTLNSTFLGNLTHFNINAKASADNVLLGDLAINGSLEKADIEITANELQLTDLLSLNITLPTKIDLIEGALSYSVKGQVTDFADIKNTPVDISVAVTSLSGEVEGIWIQALNWHQKFNFVSGMLSTQENEQENLSVELIESSTPISKLSISTSWSYKNDFKFSATKLKGDMLGGSFSIPKIKWPSEHGHSVDVQLTSIDLEQVLALDKKQGIVVTGKVSGQLPLIYDGEKYTMKQGKLYNVSNGLIQVIDNPAVEELKANNKQLQIAFGALQNLHYHQLSSDVSMADDGYMLLETVIKGRNPDIGNEVNLNLNLSYDLLGLLESMSITNQFEQQIIKGLQKY
jgi:hypothetical protein